MNKTVFITGGTSGIGKSLIYKYSENKYDIFFTYFKNSNEAKTISRNLNKKNIRHYYYKMDLSNKNSVYKTFKKFSQNFKKMNIFINNAFPHPNRKAFLNLSDEEILKNVKSMIFGNFLSFKLALKFILKSKNYNSLLVNISSYASISGGFNIHLYAASKSALNILVNALSRDFLKKKIKFFSFFPKYIDTPTFRKINKIKNNKDFILLKKKKKITKIMTDKEFAEGRSSSSPNILNNNLIAGLAVFFSVCSFSLI